MGKKAVLVVFGVLAAVFAGRLLAVVPCPVGDLNNDCLVDYYDVGVFVEQWLANGNCPGVDCANLDGVGVVNESDFALLASNWRKTAKTVVINEFMAANGNTLEDPDAPGEYPDWIELYNYGPASVDLGGMYVTDRFDRPTQYEIPGGVSIGAGEYLIIWADDNEGLGPTHTNFVLNPLGEQVGLFDTDGVTVVDSVDYRELPQGSDVSYGRLPNSVGGFRYMGNPTPMAENDGAVLGEVADTNFREERGFYDGPFDLTIICDTPGATIRYTTDGSEPSEGHGDTYEAPIPVGSTATVRAMAFRPGWQKTNIDTHTFIVGADAARKAIPTLSMAGIDGREGFVSVEVIYADPNVGKSFQTDCLSTAHGVNSYELQWRSIYGHTRLDEPFFEGAPVAADLTTDMFYRLVLRVGENSATTYPGDPWVQVTEKVMTDFGCNSMFMHLYKNGEYVEIVNPKELPDASHWVTHYGGNIQNFFILNEGYEPENGGRHLSGSPGRFNLMKGKTDLGVLANYNQFKLFCDVTDIADYTILFWYSGFGEGVDNNYYGGMGTSLVAVGEPVQGFKLTMWNGEYCFTNGGEPGGNVEPWLPDYYGERGVVIGPLWTKLLESDEFRMLFADRIYKHLFNDGALTDASSWSRWSALADAAAAAGASASSVKDNMVGFANTFIAAVEGAGLYPSVDAPTFGQHGGQVDPGFLLTMSGAETIYYTLDDSDPRAEGGGISAGASNYDSTGPATLTESTIVKARCRSAGGEWSPLAETSFGVGPVAENLRITELMYAPPDPNHEFIELQNISVTESINLRLARITKGVEFTFPSVALGPEEFVVVVRNRDKFELLYADKLGEMTIAGEYDGALNNGGERVRLKDAVGQVIQSFRYNNSWYGNTDGSGFSLTVKDPVNTEPNDWSVKTSWRSSARLNGSPGWDDSGSIQLDTVVINELLPHSHLNAPDWIELYNTGIEPVDIGGWFLSDDSNDLKKYEIAAGTTIGVDGYLVFYEDEHFGNNSDPGTHKTFAMTENGETVYLSSGNLGELTGYMDERTFRASETGIAFGRYQKSGGTYNFVAMSENTPGGPNAYPKVGPIVINEIMYNPPDLNGDAEYVELLNITTEPVLLYNLETNVPWTFVDNPDDPNAALNYVFPSASGSRVTMEAGEHILLVKDTAVFNSVYGGIVPPGTQIFEWPDGGLSNGGEQIQLSMSGDIDQHGNRYLIRVDRVSYSDGKHPNDGSDPWPTAPDDGLQSLSRRTAAEYGNDVVNWKASMPSPGSANP